MSVGDDGKCGAVLFRFLGGHAREDELHGHGKWGEQRKNVAIYRYEGETAGSNSFDLYVGDGYDFGERSEAEFRALFSSAGFELTRVVPTRSPLSVVEARVA